MQLGGCMRWKARKLWKQAALVFNPTLLPLTSV